MSNRPCLWPTSIAYSDNDPVVPAKVMNEYAGKFGKLEIKAGVVEGEIVDIYEIKAFKSHQRSTNRRGSWRIKFSIAGL